MDWNTTYIPVDVIILIYDTIHEPN